MNRIPPHVDTAPAPRVERPYYSPAQEPLASPDTVQPGVQFGRPAWVGLPHLWNYQRGSLTDNARFAIAGFTVLMLGILHLLVRNWGRAALMAVYLILLLAAPYYARHWRIPHRLARFVRNLFFLVHVYPGNSVPAHIIPRALPLMFIMATSLALLFWP